MGRTAARRLLSRAANTMVTSSSRLPEKETAARTPQRCASQPSSKFPNGVKPTNATVSNLVRGLDLPAGDTFVEDDGLEAGARRVNRGGQSRRSGTNDDHIKAL